MRDVPDGFALVVAGMVAVTYLPRLLPFIARGRGLTPWQRRFVRIVPYTAIGALVIPAGLTAVDGAILPSFVGLAVAAGSTALFRQPVVSVALAVAAVALARLIGG